VPITITPPSPGTVIGPFVLITAQSDFIGPLPSGSFFLTQVYGSPEPGPLSNILEIRTPTTANGHGVFLGEDVANSAYSTFRDHTAKDGEQIHITVELHSPSSTLDSGTITLPWQSDVGQIQLPTQIHGGTTGGLTPVQAQQLTETHASTFADQLVDDLTLIPLTAVPSFGPVNANLLDTTFGVIVRLATVPAELVPQTPDNDYWIKTLAVVRIFRGSDLWKRYPIHTSNRLISFLDESVVASVTALTATQWLLNMTMQVTFAPGVSGSVFLMRFP
jgi:hypothetical protein